MYAHETLDTSVQLTDYSPNEELAHVFRGLISRSRVYDAAITQGEGSESEVEISFEEYLLIRHRIERAERKLLELAEQHPIAFSEMAEMGVDCLHGATTLNIKEILVHGLVPSSQFQDLGVIALGKENYSHPRERTGVHVVPLGEINETRGYAEDRLKVNSKLYVNPKNYRNFLHFSVKKMREIHRYAGLHEMFDVQARRFDAHANGSAEEAKKIRDALSDGRLSPRSGSPIVFGINSDKVLPETEITFVNSAIPGDTKIEQVIRFDAIPIVYTDKKEIFNIEDGLEEYGYMDTVVRDIATIR